ncbi:hypothetical protein A2V82_13130 [candidate division KSB1 bacterium RBG_16_48_16]|nr:MAG: hypothetical protein A2V82_13130 [candidate division KSB1 bacterium RBG_16_48_16]
MIFRRQNIIAFFISILLFSGACSKLVLKQDRQTDGTQWPQFGKDAQHTRLVNQLSRFPLTLKWQHKASSAIEQSMISADGVVFIGTQDGKIEGIDIETGEKIGQVKIRGNFSATCALYKGDLVYVRRIGQPTLTRYSLKRGKTVWKVEASSVMTEPLIAGDKVFIGRLKGELDCYSLDDGTKLWTAKLPAQTHSSPAYSRGYIFIGDDDGTIHAFDEGGNSLWRFKTKAALYATPAIFETTLYIGSTDGNFYAIDAIDGTEKWVFIISNKIYNSAGVTDQLVIFGSTNKKVYCLDKNTGEQKWVFEAKSIISTAPAISNNAVFIGSLDQRIYALDLSSGESLWSFETKGRIRTDPILIDNKLLVASENDRLYCFEQE